ncbi:hypothetical protein [Microbacterium sp. lyk4-40-TSB-66]|uniref:hypothetical protein n=1 Tax=Microbacterium sp. lyk4-40-TSB-66 TaxID=3040294 RepID=UPI00254AB055|nr:hypothetical protein [Microbacterium sp. lyk4-40-TSB-66]
MAIRDVRGRGRVIHGALAIAATLGTVGALLLAVPANAAEEGVTASVSPSCDDGGTLTVWVANDDDIERTILWDIDRGNDGEADFGDGGLFEINENRAFFYTNQEDALYRVHVYTESGTDVLDQVVELDCEPTVPAERYYVTRYDGTVWRVTDQAIQRLTYADWQAAGSPQPAPAPTDYVRYAWSSTISAVTFFGQTRDRWVWQHVSYDEWARAGFPTPRNAGWIEGSTYYQWGTSDQIFVRDVGGVRHALTYAEWRDSGFEPFERRSSQGFSKLTWDNSIAFFTNTGAGQGSPIGYDRWASEGFPNPSSSPRFPGDQVWRNYGSPDIWYAGPTVYRRINGAEWAAMGNPAPEVRGTPARPARDKDCRDYGSQSQAQADFTYWYPAYGDVFGLDADGDGVACESYKY